MTQPDPTRDPTFQTRAELEWWARCQLDDFLKHAPHSRNQVQMMLYIADRIRRVMVAHLHLPFPTPPHTERPDDE